MAFAQRYHTFSIRAQNLGNGADPTSTLFLSPSLSIGKSNLQAMLALEFPTKRLAADDKWASKSLKATESVRVNRYLGKFRLKSQPRENSLGIVWLAVNQYLLDIKYQDPAVFLQAAGDTLISAATVGAGLFEFWATNSSWLKVVGAEAIVFTDFDKFDLWLELKALLPKNIKVGLVAETGRPRPLFSNFYLSLYIEYFWRW